MENKINGNLIYLRKIKSADINNRYLSWLNNKRVNQFLESRFKKWTLRDLKNYLNIIKNDKNYILFGIFLKENDLHVGNIKLGPINQVHKFADIGIMLGDEKIWGKGIGTEAVCLLTKFAFHVLHLHKLTAGAYSTNLASIKIFSKNGFKKEGIRKNMYFYDDRYIDGILFGLNNSLE